MPSTGRFQRRLGALLRYQEVCEPAMARLTCGLDTGLIRTRVQQTNSAARHLGLRTQIVITATSA